MQAGRARQGFMIRRAREEDIPRVIEVNMASLPERYWYGFYLTLLQNWGEAFLVAEADGRIVGYAMSRIEYTRDPVLLGLRNDMEGRSLIRRVAGVVEGLLSSPRKVGHLVSIAVLPGYRRRGIGSALLRETIRAVGEAYGAEALYLEVRVSNEPAIRLYEKFGFVKVRRITAYYADGEDAYVMVKRLEG